MANAHLALDTHARLELGIDPDDTGSSRQAAAMSFVSFSVGAALPLLPWFFASGMTAVLASIIIGAVAALALGATIGSFSGQGVWRTAGRQLLAAVIAGIGHLRGGPHPRGQRKLTETRPAARESGSALRQRLRSRVVRGPTDQ